MGKRCSAIPKANAADKRQKIAATAVERQRIIVAPLRGGEFSGVAPRRGL
jgi:hypothetical protein